MIAWALLTGLAFGQGAVDESLDAICDPFQPVAGTAGFSNGLTAIRTNAQTYGAGTFARNRLRGQVYFALDYRAVFGVADVPVLCTDPTAKRSGAVYGQPLDLGATNFGLAAPLLTDAGKLHMDLQVFYASSVTTSTMGSRVFTAALPLFNQYPAVFAPLIGKSVAGGSLTTFAVDWIGGATFKSDVVSVQAGYTGSNGLYVDVTQEKLALFVNSALTGGLSPSDATYLLGGVQQFDPLDVSLDAAEPAGMTSLFYRQLPQAEDEGGDEPGLIEQLRTGHLRQEDMAGIVDVRAAWQFGSQARLRELALAAHTTNWYRRISDEIDEPAGYLRLGVVNLPDQPLFGVPGGMRPTVRGVYRVINPDNGFGLELAAQMNDPDLLDLYPFAYNAFGVSLELSIDGENW